MTPNRFLSILLFFALPISSGRAALSGAAIVGTCSGAVVRLSAEDDAPAYVLSAGHCPSFPAYPKPGEASLDTASPIPSVWIYSTNREEPIQIEVDRLVYSSMTYMDVSLFRLAYSVSRLRALGVRIFEITPRTSPIGNVGGLISGRWRHEQSCRIVTHESDHELSTDSYGSKGYAFMDSYEMDSRCLAWGGISGSPLIDAEGRIFAVASRLSRNPPAFDAPKSGIPWGRSAGVLIASGVSLLAKCVDAHGFDLFSSMCPLLRPEMTNKSRGP